MKAVTVEPNAIRTVLMGEVITTFTMVTGLCFCLGFRRVRPFTPAMFPLLYAVMSYVEAVVSGTGTNPARSFGPAIISGSWGGWWIYWVGPVMGTLGGHPGLQLPRETNRGGEALPLRERSSSALPHRQSMKCDPLQLSDSARGGAATTLSRLVLRVALALAVSLAAAALTSAQPVAPHVPANVFAPESTHAWIIYKYTLLVFAITGAIFVVVGGLLLYAIVRFRQRKGDDKTEPPQVYGSEQVEIAWTVIPVIIVIVLVLTTARTIHEIQDAPRPPGALEVTAIGRQWWWEFRYPSLGIVTANELHIPVSDPAEPDADLPAPALRGRGPQLLGPAAGGEDRPHPEPGEPDVDGSAAARALPRTVRRILRHPAREDAAARLRAHPRGFRALGGRAEGAGGDRIRRVAPSASGKRVFETTACLNCHAVAGTVANGRFGPDLTHLMSRDTLAAGAVKNTAENLKLWIKDPHALKPGSLMPPMHLPEQELDALVSYLVTLK